MGRKLSGQIKEELLHKTHNAVLLRPFLSIGRAGSQNPSGDAAIGTKAI